MTRDCDFTDEEVRKLKKIMYDHDRLMIAVLGDGNGNKGLLPRCEDFFIRLDEREKIRAQKERRTKLLISIVGLIFTALLAYCAWRESQRTEVRISATHKVCERFSIEPEDFIGA